MIIKTTPVFDRLAKKLISEEELEDLFDYLEFHPDAGDLIKGTGGLRKIRWKSGKNNKGKSGGVRIIYHYTEKLLVLVITMYAKSDVSDLKQSEKNNLKKLLPSLLEKYMEDL